MISRTALNALTVLGLALAVSGCAISQRDHVYAQAFGFQCARAEGAVARTMCNETATAHGAETVSRYCYDTIGDANCFDRPDQDRKNQALGSSGY